MTANKWMTIAALILCSIKAVATPTSERTKLSCHSGPSAIHEYVVVLNLLDQKLNVTSMQRDGVLLDLIELESKMDQGQLFTTVLDSDRAAAIQVSLDQNQLLKSIPELELIDFGGPGSEPFSDSLLCEPLKSAETLAK